MFVDLGQKPIAIYDGFIWVLQKDQSWKLANYTKDVVVSPTEDNRWLARVGVMEIILLSEDEAKEWCQKNL